MTRRDFFRAAAAGVAAAAVPGSTPAAAPVPTPDVVLYRYAGGAFTRIGWFDQRRDDRVFARWTSGKVEAWTVSGPPSLVPRGPGGPPVVPSVGIWEGSVRDYGTFDPAAGVVYDRFSDTVRGCRAGAAGG